MISILLDILRTLSFPSTENDVSSNLEVSAFYKFLTSCAEEKNYCYLYTGLQEDTTI